MRANISLLQWSYEFLWILLSFVVTSIFTWSIYPNVNNTLFFYISVTMILAMNYLRWIAFPRYSPLMFSFWFKMVMLMINIPLMILMLRYFLSSLEIFDSFNFSYGYSESYFIKDGVSLEFIVYVRTLMIASFTSFTLLLLMFELRATQLIFRWRQVPGSLLK
ncbi:MAG TPA: hypothetical protein VLZ75_12410 [Chitinophagales bacterium]|nr:hypothetical protein [Chitinophagales bacterium]